jgi:hypothetical protein
MSFVVRPYQLGWNLNLPVTYHDKQRHQWTLHSNASELETKFADLRIAERELLASRKVSGAERRETAPGPKPKRKPEASDQRAT